MRTPTHSMLTFTARHATSRDPRVSHLKNQLAELIASSPLLPKSRRSLSENARREFIHHTHQCSSPHRSLSSISSDHSETVNNSRLPGEEPVSLLTSDLPPIELPPTLDMLILQPELPALPKINDERTESQVFTHRSKYARPKHEFEDAPNDPSPDNECLELLGDSVLSYLVTDLIQREYPHLRVGPATKIRSLVVENANLAEISKRYNLPRRLELQNSQAIALRSSSSLQADVFEAYVGGLHKDQGLDVVKRWISILLMPYIQKAHSIIKMQYLPQTNFESQAPLSPPSSPTASDDDPPSSPGSDQVPPTQSAQAGYITLFTQHLEKHSRRLEWTYDMETDERNSIRFWTAKAFVTEQEFAVGRGVTKKLAKEAASKVGAKKLNLD